MDAYLDTVALVPLFANEVFSEAITAYMERRGKATAIHAFHRLEFKNAMELKKFRAELSTNECLVALRKVDEYAAAGKLALRPVNWIAAFDKAREIAGHVTGRTGCRTLDLIHIAIAMQWGCGEFVSADDRQLKAAKMLGLKTVDIRALPVGSRPDNPGRIRERGRAYRAKKRDRTIRVECIRYSRGIALRNMGSIPNINDP